MSHPPTAPPPAPARLGLPVFLLTFAVYAALVPWMVKVWPRTGDEPHYLLAAHSLAFDGDFDLNNNYTQRDYLSFYGDHFLNPHTRPGPNGQAVLTHNLGLSLLIAPVYRLGGFVAVEYFLAALGALLAANVFLLGYHLSANWLAALVGWAAVSFTPPVLWYVFLVYPEIVAALCLVLALRHLLDGAQPPLGHLPFVISPFVISSFAIASLPWLSSRYLPVFSLLVLGALLRARRDQSRGWLFTALGGLAGLGAYAVFSLWLYGSASPSASYTGPTPIGVHESFVLTRIARGLLGWLTDNQRGVLVSAPIYIAALWGSGLLLWRRRLAGLAVGLPLALTLVPVAVWGGFWIGWEHSARFLVVALPPLGAGLAYLWAAGRRMVVVPLTLLLLWPSLSVGRAVIAEPIMGIVSSPIEQLKPRLDLEALIPAMGGYAFIPAGREAVVGAPGGLGWRAPAGQSGIVLRQVDVPEFPFGWYTARLPLQASGAQAPQSPSRFNRPALPAPPALACPGCPPGQARAAQVQACRQACPWPTPVPAALVQAGPGAQVARAGLSWPTGQGPGRTAGQADTPLATIRIFSPRGGTYFSQTVYGRDLPEGAGEFVFHFKNPLYNGWGFPPTVLVSTTGQAELSLGVLSIEPERYHSLILPVLWLMGLALGGALVVAQAAEPRPLLVPTRALPPLNLVLVLAAIAAVGWSLRPQPRTYAAVDLKRTVGERVDDPLAFQGWTMQADPSVGHEAGMLAVTFPEIYAPGRYRLTVSMWAASIPEPRANVAAVRVFASDVGALALRWDVPGSGFPTEGEYHRFSFDFENPRQQALTFILDYPATTALRADVMIVAPRP
jgi:hypothetical protein